MHIWSFQFFKLLPKERKNHIFFYLCLVYPFFSQALVRNCTFTCLFLWSSVCKGVNTFSEVFGSVLAWALLWASGWTHHWRTRGSLAHLSWLLRTWEGHWAHLLLFLKASPWVPKVNLFHVIPVILLPRQQQNKEHMAAKHQKSGSSCSVVLVALFCVFWLKVPVLLRAHSPIGINPRIPFRQVKYFNVFKLGWRCLP